MEKKIGLNIHSGRIDGDIELLKRDLEAIEQAGFGLAEIPVHGVDAVVNGELQARRAEQIREILNEFSLEYTVHAPDLLNLKDFRYPDVHRRVFAASIRFTAVIGARAFIYHEGTLKSNGEGITPEEARELEMDSLADLGRLAQAEGVIICIENIRSSLIHLTKLIESIGEESVKLCCDVAHSYINANTLGYDFLRSIQLAEPYIRHVHANDNFGKGKPETAPTYREAMPLGIGDLHLPIGWGTIPYKDVFQVLEGHKGPFVLELQERFFENGYGMLQEALSDAKAVMQRATAKC